MQEPRSTLRFAIMYTGQQRTLTKVFPFFIQNVVVPLLVSSDDACVDVFAVVQDCTDDTIAFMKESLGDRLRSCDKFDRNASKMYTHLQSTLADRMQISDRWKEYLVGGGSMVEYYQLFLANIRMESYESSVGMVYDYVLRVRTDVIIARPIDVSWLQWTPAEIEHTLRTIESTDAEQRVCTFMNSLLRGSDPKCGWIRDVRAENKTADSCWFWQGVGITDNASITGDVLHKYIHTGKYVLAMRSNLTYFCPRKCIIYPAKLGIQYGAIRGPPNLDYWFNAECQFRLVCESGGATVFDSCTRKEDLSVCDYKTERYFANHKHNDDDNIEVNLNTIIDIDPDIFCIICRHAS